MRIPSYLYIIPFLLSFNLASAQNIITVIYALNHRGELFWRKSTDTQWTKAPDHKLRSNYALYRIVTGPSVNKDGKHIGQLYKYHQWTRYLWQAQDVTIENPCGTSWEKISCPIDILYLAPSRSKLFINSLRRRFAKDIFGSQWQIQPPDDYAISSISPDLPEIAVGRMKHEVKRFLRQNDYYYTLGSMSLDTGKLTDTGKPVSNLVYARIGVRGSCIEGTVSYSGSTETLWANANILDKNEQWVEILPPPSLNRALGLDDNIRPGHILNCMFAIGLATDQYGNVINEIWRSDLFLSIRDLNVLLGGGFEPDLEYAKSALWRRTGITVEHPFGSGWELVETHAGNEPTGIITSLAIGSFDQTEAIKEEQRKAAEAKKAEQAQKLAEKKAEQKKAAAEKREKEEKRWDAAKKRRQSLSPKGPAVKKQKTH